MPVEAHPTPSKPADTRQWLSICAAHADRADSLLNMAGHASTRVPVALLRTANQRLRLLLADAAADPLPALDLAPLLAAITPESAEKLWPALAAELDARTDFFPSIACDDLRAAVIKGEQPNSISGWWLLILEPGSRAARRTMPKGAAGVCLPRAAAIAIKGRWPSFNDLLSLAAVRGVLPQEVAIIAHEHAHTRLYSRRGVLLRWILVLGLPAAFVVGACFGWSALSVACAIYILVCRWPFFSRADPVLSEAHAFAFECGAFSGGGFGFWRSCVLNHPHVKDLGDQAVTDAAQAFELILACRAAGILSHELAPVLLRPTRPAALRALRSLLAAHGIDPVADAHMLSQLWVIQDCVSFASAVRTRQITARQVAAASPA
ncbi:MAG: hypothetical protein JSR77_12995 [Planctomycetes bacterium]|nr:hypothetical protein [Planctomycetota bacterium]